MKLVPYNTQDGIELVIDHSTGEAFAGLRAIARMCQTHPEKVKRKLRTVTKTEAKTAEIQTTQGLRTVTLYTAEAVFDVAFDLHPSLAKAMAKAGATLYLQRLAGFEWQQSPVKQPELNMRELAAAYLKTCEENDRLKESVDELVEENAVLAPKAQAYDFYFNAEGLTTIEEFAKTVNLPGVGRNKMFVILRDIGIIQKISTLPYQQFVPRYFVVRPEVLPSGSTYNRAYLTKEGVQLLLNKLQLV